MIPEDWPTVWIADPQPHLYRWWCRFAGHLWRRRAYDVNWVKPVSCRRCEDIPPPWPPRR